MLSHRPLIIAQRQIRTGDSKSSASTAYRQSGQQRSAVRVPVFLQAKLPISQPDDPDEQEANRVADQIMHMREPMAQRQCAACAAGGALCPACKDKQVAVSRMTQDGAVAEAPASVGSVIRSPGQPLSASTRAFFGTAVRAGFWSCANSYGRRRSAIRARCERRGLYSRFAYRV